MQTGHGNAGILPLDHRSLTYKGGERHQLTLLHNSAVPFAGDARHEIHGVAGTSSSRLRRGSGCDFIITCEQRSWKVVADLYRHEDHNSRRCRAPCLALHQPDSAGGFQNTGMETRQGNTATANINYMSLSRYYYTRQVIQLVETVYRVVRSAFRRLPEVPGRQNRWSPR